MDQRAIAVFFALLRSAIRGTVLSEPISLSSEEKAQIVSLAQKHDVTHLLAAGLRENGMLPQGGPLEQSIFYALYRYERQQHEYLALCSILEEEKIPFLPLKGAILRDFYPEAWMRTGCDLDILVHKEDLERATTALVRRLSYKKTEHGTHDVTLIAPSQTSIELHFDLVEEDRANNAISLLCNVWEYAKSRAGYEYFYEMSDAFFYFYHIAHMAKHFETGGCGIRPFLDLWILDRMEGADASARDALLKQGGLLQFANASRALSRFWFEGGESSEISLAMQDYLLHGGVYGSSDNRVALQQKKNGGKTGYLLSRVFISKEKLKRYYPILEKHPYLMPVMQVRRWFMLFRPDVSARAKKELETNRNLDQERAEKMADLLKDVGL